MHQPKLALNTLKYNLIATAMIAMAPKQPVDFLIKIPFIGDFNFDLFLFKNYHNTIGGFLR